MAATTCPLGSTPIAIVADRDSSEKGGGSGMDVLCVGMYRACSTWQYEVAAHLVERHRRGRRLGYLTGPEYHARTAEHSGRAGGWAVLKSHEEHRSFTRRAEEGRAITIYGHRDVRDVVFSLMHKRAMTFEEILARGMIHQVLANDRFWSGRPGVLVQRYDRLVADPTAGVAELAAHLGIAIGPGEATEVAAEYSFEANRRRIVAIARTLRDRVDDPSCVQVYDPRTLLHWNHLRGGRVGDWRAIATPRQVAALAIIAGDWLIARGYEPDPSWADASAAWSPGRLERIRLRAEVARGAMTCRLRCLSLRHPELAAVAKRIAMIPTEATAARAVGEPHPAPRRSGGRRRAALAIEKGVSAGPDGVATGPAAC